VVREISLDCLETNAAFVARHDSPTIVLISVSNNPFSYFSLAH
jgi:hypothetical protein